MLKTTTNKATATGYRGKVKGRQPKRKENPWKGEQQPIAWRVALKMLTGKWVKHRVLIQAMMDASGIQKKTADNLIAKARKHGVLVPYGAYDRGYSDDREYTLAPKELNKGRLNALVWYPEGEETGYDLLAGPEENGEEVT